MSFGPDIYDNAPWSEMDIEDLKNHVAHGATIEETAEYFGERPLPPAVQNGRQT
jgi:hypothetical protein